VDESKRKKARVPGEKSAREKDLTEGLTAYRNKFRVPDAKHETGSWEKMPRKTL
jgi:hypothetical protein